MPLPINIPDLLRLASIPKLGNHRLKTLVTHFSSPAEVFRASARELHQVEGIDKKLASVIAHFSPDTAFVDDQLSRINKVNGRIISFWDPEYPALLKKIYDPPVLLFLRGELVKNDNFSIGIVGTRHPSVYGKLMTEKFSRELAEKGITIVSGLARGVDTIAHQSALHSKGRTVAIIGSSLDHLYPPENKKLADAIEHSGAVISEFFMGTKTDPGNFPRRNRIISGMSLGTLIIESAEDGGAMITGTLAIDQNRELFCLPGPITEKQSKGTNALIKNGQAKLVQSVEDILVELEIPLRPIISSPHLRDQPQLSLFEQRLFDILSADPIHIDTIAESSGLSISETLVALLNLEFKGLIRQLAGKMFVRN